MLLTSPSRESPRRQEWRHGLRDAFPIVVGYLPIAVAYGVLAVQAGISPLATVAMSIVVYAGASQMMAVGMIAAGGLPPAIVLTVLAVNLRHVLMSSAVGVRLPKLSLTRLTALGFSLTDESFAVVMGRLMGTGASVGWMCSLQMVAYLSWIAGSVVGALAGQRISDPARWGLDFALPAMFVALLLLQVRGRRSATVAVAAAALYRIAAAWMAGHWAVIVAACTAAWLATVLERGDGRVPA